MLSVIQSEKEVSSRRKRAVKIAEFTHDLRNHDIAGMILPQEVHEWCVDLICHPEKRLSHRREWTFDSILYAINYVERAINAESRCLVFGYNLDTDISLMMPKEVAFTNLRERNTILSVDGVILANVNITSLFILDYEDANREMSLSRVFCSAIGEVALDPKFPGAREDRQAN